MWSRALTVGTESKTIHFAESISFWPKFGANKAAFTITFAFLIETTSCIWNINSNQIVSMHKVINILHYQLYPVLCDLISSNGTITSTTANDYCDIISINYPLLNK